MNKAHSHMKWWWWRPWWRWRWINSGGSAQLLLCVVLSTHGCRLRCIVTDLSSLDGQRLKSGSTMVNYTSFAHPVLHLLYIFIFDPKLLSVHKYLLDFVPNL
ncbi:hypothetical protein BRARA_E01442 [Brassica rapa]|uniref:Uncharacterized protein n=1 Tax=Brassica campestris TaxID=3711 RepID=A0A397ZA26_BRACM|nr:hypothetical protein BRARA_E01442 [Brassica rapa]